MKTLEEIGWVLGFLGFVLGLVRSLWVTAIAVSKVTRDWKPLSRKDLSDLEPLLSKQLFHVALALMGFALVMILIAKYFQMR